MFNAKEALLCVFKRLNFARKPFWTHFCARQFIRGSFFARLTISVATRDIDGSRSVPMVSLVWLSQIIRR